MTQPSSNLKKLLERMTKTLGVERYQPYDPSLTDGAIKTALSGVNASLRNPGPARTFQPRQTPKKVRTPQSHFRGADADDLHIRIVSDGTLTEVTLHPIDKWSGLPNLNEHIARGVSKRRKGETRSNTLGVALAMSRAYAVAAQRYEEMAEKELDR